MAILYMSGGRGRAVPARIERLAGIRNASYNPEMAEKEDILKVAGEALYGRQWQAPLSRDLGVTDRTVRNWVAGSGRPADISVRILPLLEARARELEHAIALLQGATGGVH